MRIIRLGVMLLFVLPAGLAAAPSSPKSLLNPIECKGVSGLTDMIACEHPDILQDYAGIEKEFLRLQGQFKGHDRKLFIAQYLYGRIDFNKCTDVVNGNYRPHAEVVDCFRDRLAAQHAYFRSVQSDRSVLKANAASHDFIDVWYLKEFAKEYNGRTIHVSGEFHFMTCRDMQAPPRARLFDDYDRKIWVDYMLSPLSDWERDRFCKNGFLGSWKGVVKLKNDGTPYLEFAS